MSHLLVYFLWWEATPLWTLVYYRSRLKGNVLGNALWDSFLSSPRNWSQGAFGQTCSHFPVLSLCRLMSSCHNDEVSSMCLRPDFAISVFPKLGCLLSSWVLLLIYFTFLLKHLLRQQWSKLDPVLRGAILGPELWHRFLLIWSRSNSRSRSRSTNLLRYTQYLSESVCQTWLKWATNGISSQKSVVLESSVKPSQACQAWLGLTEDSRTTDSGLWSMEQDISREVWPGCGTW